MKSKENHHAVNNPDDWVARFSKHNRFPAQEWAERMAKLYNLKIYGVQGLPCCPK